jgi:hypothetical protein
LVVGVDELEAEVGVGVVLGRAVAGDAGSGGIDVVEAARRAEPVAVDEIRIPRCGCARRIRVMWLRYWP